MQPMKMQQMGNMPMPMFSMPPQPGQGEPPPNQGRPPPHNTHILNKVCIIVNYMDITHMKLQEWEVFGIQNQTLAISIYSQILITSKIIKVQI